MLDDSYSYTMIDPNNNADESDTLPSNGRDPITKPQNKQASKFAWASLIIMLLVNILLVAITGTFVILFDLGIIKPVAIRGFFKDDRSIQLPFLNYETIKLETLLVFSFIIPIVVILVVDIIEILGNLLVEKRRFRNRHSILNLFVRTIQNIFVFLLGILLVTLVTFIVKQFVGKLRPDFISRCEPDYSTVVGDYVFPNDQAVVCKGNPAHILEGRKSFPSGHASTSFYSMTFAALYIENIHRRSIASAIKPTIQVLFIFIAFLCSLTRITDNVHHGIDVFSGAIIGILAALYFEFNIRRRHNISMDTILSPSDANKRPEYTV